MSIRGLEPLETTILRKSFGYNFSIFQFLPRLTYIINIGTEEYRLQIFVT